MLELAYVTPASISSIRFCNPIDLSGVEGVTGLGGKVVGSGINSPALTGLPTLSGGVTGAGLGALDLSLGSAGEPSTGLGLGATG